MEKNSFCVDDKVYGVKYMYLSLCIYRISFLNINL